MDLQKHWMYFFWPVVATIFTGGIGVIWLIYRALHYFMDKITISEQNFNIKVGIISICSRSTPLNRINNVEYRQNILGRILGYGTIYIQSGTTLGTTSCYSYISNPENIKNMIDSKMQKVSIVIPQRIICK